MAVIIMAAVRTSDITTDVHFDPIITDSGSFISIGKMVYLYIRECVRLDWADFWKHET
jgi:hypothetical protein